MSKSRAVKQDSTFRGMFEQQGGQFLKKHFLPYLDKKQRTILRATCTSIQKEIPPPNFYYYGRYVEYQDEIEYFWRYEKNTQNVEFKNEMHEELKANVIKVCESEDLGHVAFLKSNGKLILWSHDESHEDYNYYPEYVRQPEELNSNVVDVFSTHSAFAALLSNRKLLTWGYSGGDSSSVREELSSNVMEVFSTGWSFAALKPNGKLVIWGMAKKDYNIFPEKDALSSNVTKVVSNMCAFAALKSNGKVISWGFAQYGGDSSSVRENLNSNVVKIVANNYGFKAIKSNEDLITWGGRKP